MKKILIWCGVVLLIVAIGGGTYAYSRRGVVEVQTGRVERRNLLQLVTASGEITPRNYVDIGANSLGRITDLYVLEGDRVEPGQRLAKLETVQPAAEVAAQKASLQLFRAELVAREAGIAANEANQRTQEAALTRTEAELQRARINYERAGQLLEEKLISRQDYDGARADFEAAAASVEEAKARLAELRVQRDQLVAQEQSADWRVDQAEAQLLRATDVLEKHYSVAPLAGIVTNLPVRVGETVVPGIQNSSASLIMTIADMSLITAEVKVDETDIVHVKLDQIAEVEVDALPDSRFQGRVIEIGNTAILRSTGLAASQTANTSQEAKDFKVVVALEDPSTTIRPGMSCTARITTATRNDVLTLPIQALTVRPAKALAEPDDPNSAQAAGTLPDPDEEIEGVFVVEENKAVFRRVDTGVTGTTHIEATAGLNEQAEIVTGNYKVLRTLKNKAKIRIKNDDDSSSWWSR